MSNTTSAITSISSMDITRASAILLTMDSYMIVILYIIGILGALLNIITFRQKRIRTNPCAVYFLSTSIVDFCIINITVLMEIITRFNSSLFTLIYSTRFWCKGGNYLTFVLTCLSSSYITFASVDRFCASSLNQVIRKWSNLFVSRVVVGIILMIWVLFGLHIPIAYDFVRDSSTNTSVCKLQINSVTAFLIIDGFFFSLFNGIIVPLILSILGLLILHHVKSSRRRVNIQQQNNHNKIRIRTTILANRQNMHMITMLLVQVSLTVIFNAPFIVIYLLNFYRIIPQDLLSLLIYIIFSFIARWFYYMNYCKTFYINTLTSSLFRNSLRKQSIQFFRHCQ